MRRIKKILRFITKIFLFTFVIIILITLYCNWRINTVPSKYIYDSVDSIPFNKVGLVPGTSKYLVNGNMNRYFKYRLESAVELYKAGKIQYLLVSGDNSHISYNEPVMMKKTLMEMGVPDSAVYLDYAGFRTFDSMIRCKKVFGQDSFTIISQEFQNERAVYIARKKDIEAIAYNAQDIEFTRDIKTKTREWFARVKVFIDLYIIHNKPKFLGDKIKIG